MRLQDETLFCFREVLVRLRTRERRLYALHR